ncbi:Putative protein of unknown function [Podospora comata]|uniref:Hypervirulence associated protein TUDOR domain-containing protein n=1 Tax=Podospora comata TaxID=48703 RepID=A0ABY6S8E5_PODCO|nr:Putative protein of unknown function [Podospora comata]
MHEIGDAVIYKDAEGDEALGIVRSVMEPTSKTAATLYEIQDIESGETFTVVETRVHSPPTIPSSSTS